MSDEQNSPQAKPARVRTPEEVAGRRLRGDVLTWLQVIRAEQGRKRRTHMQRDELLRLGRSFCEGGIADYDEHVATVATPPEKPEQNPAARDGTSSGAFGRHGSLQGWIDYLGGHDDEYSKYIVGIVSPLSTELAALRGEVAKRDARLTAIADTLIDADYRASAVDGPVTPTHQALTAEDVRSIWRAATEGEAS